MGSRSGGKSHRKGGEEMTLTEFGAAVAEIGIPAVYGYHREETAPPYIAYASTLRNVIYADGVVVYSEEWVELKLVTKSRSIEAENSIELLFNQNGLQYDDPEFVFDEKQGIHTATYYFQLEEG